MRFFKFIVLASQIQSALLLAQDNISESFIFNSKNISIHNPSLSCRDSDLTGNLAYRSFTGKFSVIRTYFADVNYAFIKPKKNKKSGIRQISGLGLYNDREGEFFSKIRVMTRYAIHVPLSPKFFFSSGANFHLINYNFNVSGAGASGSDWAWSTGFGLSLFSSDFCISASVNDVNNPTVAPVAFEFSIPRYAMLFAEKKFQLNEQFDLKTAARYSFNSQTPNGYFLEFGLGLPHNIAVSALHYNLRGSGAAVALNNIKVNNGLADFSLAYLAPGKGVVPAVPDYELNLRFYIGRE